MVHAFTRACQPIRIYGDEPISYACKVGVGWR
jgi:hypothetical protein